MLSYWKLFFMRSARYWSISFGKGTATLLIPFPNFRRNMPRAIRVYDWLLNMKSAIPVVSNSFLHISPVKINLPMKRSTCANVDSFVMLWTTWIHVVEKAGIPAIFSIFPVLRTGIFLWGWEKCSF